MDELAGAFDLIVAIHVVHEVPDQEMFFADAWHVLKPEGKTLFVEPRGHVSRAEFDQSLTLARKVGFIEDAVPARIRGRHALLVKELDL